VFCYFLFPSSNIFLRTREPNADERASAEHTIHYSYYPFSHYWHFRNLPKHRIFISTIVTSFQNASSQQHEQ